MTELRVENKWDFTRSLINEWLALPGKQCANCGTRSPEEASICDRNDCAIGTNVQIAMQVIKENETARNTQLNPYGSNKSKTMRQLLALPPTLMVHLEQGWLNRYGRRFLSLKGESDIFAKKFKQFTVCEVV